MKVLLASWAPFHAGAEVAACRLASGLQEAGHGVTVVLGTKGDTFTLMQQAGLDVRYLPLVMTDRRHWWRYIAAQRGLRKIIREISPDIVHANDLPTSQMIGQAARRLNIPRVCHHRWFFGDDVVRWLNKFGAELHIFVSHSFMSQMLADSEELRVSNCCPLNDAIQLPQLPTAADRLAARSNLGILPTQPMVLFAGQLIERKGVEDLLRAWQLLPTERAQAAQMIIVGEDLENAGAYRTHLQSLASELQVNARFVGFQKNVGDWITAADLCVVPSHNEPFGLAVLEGMAHARPVIGTNEGGIPEMIVDGETGLLVPARDPAQLSAAIAKLLTDADLRDRLGSAARARCEAHFSLSSHVTKIVCEYSNLLTVRVPALA